VASSALWRFVTAHVTASRRSYSLDSIAPTPSALSLHANKHADQRLPYPLPTSPLHPAFSSSHAVPLSCSPDAVTAALSCHYDVTILVDDIRKSHTYFATGLPPKPSEQVTPGCYLYQRFSTVHSWGHIISLTLQLGFARHSAHLTSSNERARPGVIVGQLMIWCEILFLPFFFFVTKSHLA
jgi:hypothetical protein